ncbi:MAG: hypothetical protein ABIT01_09580 [Thermoanaerobaculia bacterium]
MSSLAGDGATLWAGSSRGVWRLSSDVWALDGLSNQTITSVAVSGGLTWAATGDGLFSRAVNGTWSAEPSGIPVALPAVLLADGSTLYAAGVGVSRRSGSTWARLPSPGSGLVLSAALFGPDLVVGLSSGGAARYNGTSWSAMSAGIPISEGATALTVLSGTLYAGTPRGFYTWTGVAWTADVAFGQHDVRALTSFGSTLRIATADAGVFRRSGAAWIAENAGLLTFRTRSFATLASDLYLGTGGGPVYRSVGASWSEVGAGTLNASSVSDVLAGPTSTSLPTIATRGGGVLLGSSSPPVPDGCGDLYAVAPSPSPTSQDIILASACGPLSGRASFSSISTGLPQGALLTSLTATDGQGILGGSSNAGAFRFTGSAWSADNSGLSANAVIQTVRRVGSRLYAASSGLLFERTGNWVDVSTGLPTGATVSALGGVAASYAGLISGGLYRREGSSVWRREPNGMNTNAVFSIDETGANSGGRLFVAGGKGGVFVKREGGYTPESVGLPEGVDARVVRAIPLTNPSRIELFAGTSGHGLFSASALASVQTIPVVLDVVGGTGARFRTELIIGSRNYSGDVSITFQPAPGFGFPEVDPGTTSITLSAGKEFRAADALEFLRSRGIPIPASSPSQPIAGSLSISGTFATQPFPLLTDDLYAIARTYTRDAAGGSYGLFYDAMSDIDAPEGEATIYGLRSVAGVSRSNLAVVHLPGRGVEPITLSVQVYSDSGVAAGAPLEKSLAPGEWYQFNGVLGVAGLPEGAFGYARITRTAGVGAWSAYGIVNDAATSDGSYLPAFRPGGLSSARRLIVPVVLDLYGAAGSHFTTEVTLANDSSFATPIDLVYQPAPGFGEAPGVTTVTIPSLAAHAQLTIRDIIQYLREHGIRVPDPAIGGAQAGTLFVDFRFLTNLDTPRTIVLARTSTPNPNTAVGGAFGLFYPAVARGGGARTSATVPALAQDDTVRSNLAVVHTRGGSDLALGLSVQLFDTVSGAAVGNPLSITLQPGDWYQWSRVLEAAGVPATTSQARAVITRVFGDDTFFAYGVLNDANTSDGSFLEMIPDVR